MKLNTNSPIDRLPARSVWFSYLLGVSIVSSLSAISLEMLLSDRAVATPLLSESTSQLTSSTDEPSLSTLENQAGLIAENSDQLSFSSQTVVDPLLITVEGTETDKSDFSNSSGFLDADRYELEHSNRTNPSTFLLNTEEVIASNLAEPLPASPQTALKVDSVESSTIDLVEVPETDFNEVSQSHTSQNDDLENGIPENNISQSATQLMGVPLIRTQEAIVLEGDDFSARARLTGTYPINSNIMFGATVDLTTGDAFSDSQEDSLNLNELYVSVTPDFTPTLRFTVGLLDLTAYFDRNSFAKDAVTHFLNPVFQTNPALASAGIGSRPAILVGWTPVDQLDIKVAAFSSDRDLGDFALDGVAGEIGLRLDNLIVRGTFASDTDSGQEDGFQEIFQFDRGNNRFGLRPGDREDAFGLNAEWFIPEWNVGLFGRYGWYENRSLDRGGETFSVGVNVLDLFLPDDRLGLAYGQQLSNHNLRDEDDKTPDVVEIFYDARILPFLRAGVSLQSQEEFSETVLGFRIRADFNLTGPQGVGR